MCTAAKAAKKNKKKGNGQQHHNQNHHSRHLRRATREDALYLSTRLRKADVEELYAASGIGPLEALVGGFESCTPHVWVLEEPTGTAAPYLMGGVRPIGEDGCYGLVWLLASPDIERHALTVQKEAKRMLLRIFKEGNYHAVSNVVSAANHTAIAWLKRLGFVFPHTDVPIGINGEPFHAFAMGAKEKEAEGRAKQYV